MRSLLRAMPEGLKRGGSGFPADWTISLDYDGALPLQVSTGVSAPDEAAEYEIKVDIDRPARRWFWPRPSRLRSKSETVRLVTRRSTQDISDVGAVEALILVWPFEWVTDLLQDAVSPGWLGDLQRQTSRIRARRVYVLLTRYDKVLTARDDRAIETLLDPRFTRDAVRELLRLNPVLGPTLSGLARRGANVRLLPVSAYGVIRCYWVPNWTPAPGDDTPGGEMLMSPDGRGLMNGLLAWNPERASALAHGHAVGWLPLFTADGLVAAAHDVDHGGFFALSDFVAGASWRRGLP